MPPGDYAAIGPTYGDARDTMVEHRKSGLLRVLGGAVAAWNRSIGELKLVNGATIFIDGAEDGAERIQGKELRVAWCDEIGLWKKISAWQESLEFAVRADPALIIATGTPKGKKGIVKLLTEEPPDRVVFSFPKLTDNERNLAKTVVEGWRRRYGGTRLGRQELEGEIIAEVAGALWRLDTIEDTRIREEIALAPEFQVFHDRTVVAIDPAASAEEGSDETGIVAARLVVPERHVLEQLGWDPTVSHGLVLADRSGVYTPTEWAEAAIELADEVGADRIIGERNNGGEMVETVLRTVRPSAPYKSVWASKGKRTRAEPVSALYEKHRVHHVDALPELESEQTSWVPGEDSPSRMDALVWALTELFIGAGASTETRSEEIADAEPQESLTADLMDKAW